MHVLEVKNLICYYGKTKALHGVSFHLAAGEILGFIGPNGAGKSTMMKCIAGLKQYKEGSIHILGHDLQHDRNEALSHIGLSIESPGLYPQLTGMEHLLYFGRLRGLPESRVREMAQFSKLDRALERRAGTYSMGMKQRLALALALLHSPKLLLLDEPTNGLDPGAVATLRKEILDLRAQGIGILYSSHQLDEVERICDRSIFIQNGALLDTSTLDAIRYHSYSFYFAETEPALQFLKQSFPTLPCILTKSGALELHISREEDFADLLKQLSIEGFTITRIQENNINLEDRYAKLYQK